METARVRYSLKRGKKLRLSVSMLWNWYTVDACFLSSSWHISSKVMFAGTVFGVFFLCCAIELVRRLAREYDKRLIKVAKVSLACRSSAPTISGIAAGEMTAVDGDFKEDHHPTTKFE